MRGWQIRGNCYLFADGQRVEDPCRVIDESGLQHLIRLVKDGEPHIVHTQDALADELLHPARGAHTDLTRPRSDLVLREAEAPDEGLDLDILHLLPDLLSHSHPLQLIDQSEDSFTLTGQSETSRQFIFTGQTQQRQDL